MPLFELVSQLPPPAGAVSTGQAGGSLSFRRSFSGASPPFQYTQRRTLIQNQLVTLDHIHYAGPSRGPAEQGQTEPRCPRVAQYMFGPVDSRTGSGSARSRLPSGESLSRSRAASLVNEWHAKTKISRRSTRTPEVVVLYKLADICTTLSRQYHGAVGDVARALGGALVAPPIDATNIRQYFGDLKGFGAINDLITIVTRGVPVKVAPARADFERTLRYGNHRSDAEHLPAIWERLSEDVWCQKCIVIRKEAAHEIPWLQVSPLAAVVNHKVWIIHDFSFEAQSKGTKGGLNADTDPDAVQQCLCGEALPKFLTELVSLRKKYPNKRILMSKADVSDAF